MSRSSPDYLQNYEANVRKHQSPAAKLTLRLGSICAERAKLTPSERAALAVKLRAAAITFSL